MDVLKLITETKLVPVVAINKVEDTIPTVKALINGGLPIIEITYRTACAKEAIKTAINTFKNAAIGAGTVINEAQAKEAIEIGVKFIVSPGFSKKVADLCKKAKILYLPGVITPTEIMQAIDAGYTLLKYFPASDFGGLKTIKALGGPFPQVKFLPTGGINESNILEYLAYDKIIAVGGSFMMKGTPKEIEEKTRNAVKLIKGGK